MEKEKSKIWEATKGFLIGVGVIAVAFATADVVLMKTGLYMASGV